MKKLIIFDLDGTLIDSITDIGNSMNHVLKNNNLKEFTKDDYISFIGNGSKKLTERVCIPNNITKDDEIEKIHKEYKLYYNDHCADSTKEFDNATNTLLSLKELGIKLAILSNKPKKDCNTIANKLFPNIFDLVVGVDENILPKPNTDGIKYILKYFKVKAKDCLYVGDSGADIETASAMNIENIVCMYGYNSDDKLSKSLKTLKNKNHLIYQFSEIKNYIDNSTFLEATNSVEQINLDDKKFNLISLDDKLREKSVEEIVTRINKSCEKGVFRFEINVGYKENNHDDLVYLLSLYRSLTSIFEKTKKHKPIIIIENSKNIEELFGNTDNLSLIVSNTNFYRLWISYNLINCLQTTKKPLKVFKHNTNKVLLVKYNNNNIKFEKMLKKHNYNEYVNKF